MRAFFFNIALIILFVNQSLYSQTYLPAQVFTIQQGLSSENVTSLLVDPTGYLWIGTSQGLNRYDGYKFIPFYTENSNQFSDNEPSIKKIINDAEDHQWILSEKGIFRINHLNGTLQKFSSSLLPSGNVANSDFTDIFADTNGRIWVLSDSALYLISGEEDVHSFTIPVNQLAQNTVTTCIGGDPEGNIWIGTSAGLLVFNSNEQVFREFMLQNSLGLLSDTYINCIFYGHGNLWVGTKNGMNRFDPVDFAFEQMYPAGTQERQAGNNILAISADEKNDLVIATQGGIKGFNTENQLFYNVYSSVDTDYFAVTVDQSGIIWVASDNGLIKLREAVFSVKNFTAESQDLRLQENIIRSLGILPDGNLFIGYEDNHYDLVNMGSFNHRTLQTTDGSQVIDIYPFTNNNYLILSEHDLILYQTNRQIPTSLSESYSFIKKDLLQNAKINCLYYDGEYNLWLGTDTGLQQIRFDSLIHHEIRALKFGNRRMEIDQVYDIEMDVSGILWLATVNGLVSYNLSNGESSKYTPYDKNLLNTENKKVYTMVPAGQGQYWIGTSGGAYKFEIQNRDFTAISDDPRLLKSTFRSLAVDNNNNLWLGSKLGLYYYRTATKNLIKFDQQEGLINYSYSAVTAGPDGMVYLGGQSGLSVVNASDMQIISHPNPVVITALRFLEKEPSQKDLFNQLPDTVYLPWNKKILQVDLAVLDFSRPDLNQFMYAFGENEEDLVWYQLETTHQISFEPLAPGEYILRVNGSNSGMVWNSNPITLVVIIEAPYWRSGIALWLYIFTGIILVAIILWVLIRQMFNLSRENQEREMFAKQIMLQKEELTLKNKSITDSINYAKRIQTAMLPPYKLFKALFPSSFILYIPKDIVSGDFYWVNKMENKIFVAAVDCTGHGVPGAFMSIIGFELFRKITNIEGLTRPSDILNRLNEDFHVIFQDVDNVVLRDGMDVAFCSIDKKDMILEYSGAFNPLYLIRDNKITEVKGDRFAIGLDETNFKNHTFKNHLIPVQKGDIIYIFSDGFADQFGGPDGKKYKYRRFRHLLLNLHQLPMEKQHEILENNVFEWRGEQEQVDDILVIGIKIDF